MLRIIYGPNRAHVLKHLLSLAKIPLMEALKRRDAFDKGTLIPIPELDCQPRLAGDVIDRLRIAGDDCYR